MRKKIEKFAESRERRIATVAKWKASGLTQAEFCRREGYQQWQLSEWRRWVEKLERQTEVLPGQNRPDKSRSRRQENKRKSTQPPPEREEIAAGPPPFVPVRLVDAGIGTIEPHPAHLFNSVLELVLKHGQIIRVAPNCPPQFLDAIVATLER
ncbi:MAG: hypothetical protein LAO04_22005 [Acidobacteriia bacterium]|nr:hypothetical protein [Terriglobia bacterium]